MGGDASSRKNESELLEIMETTYLTKAWEEWEELFEEAGVWYQKIQSVEQVVEDEQAARAWVPIPPSPLVRNRSPPAGSSAFSVRFCLCSHYLVLSACVCSVSAFASACACTYPP